MMAESLESRLLLTADVRIYDVLQGGEPVVSSTFVVNDRMYYVDTDEDFGNEIYELDPATDTTRRVTDLNPGSGHSLDRISMVVGTDIYFVDQAYEDLLRKLDTTTGDIATWNFTRAREFSRFGNELWFQAVSPGIGAEAHRLDTLTGQVQSYDIDVGPSASSPRYFNQIGDDIFFEARVRGDRETRRLDPVTGSVTTYNVHPDSSSFPSRYFVAGTDLFFSARTPDSGYELQRLDTLDDSITTFDINPGTNNSDSSGLELVGDFFYFSANSGDGPEVKRLNTVTDEITSFDTNPNNNPVRNVSRYTVVGTDVYFSVNDPLDDSGAVYRVDEAGVLTTFDVKAESWSSLVRVGNDLWFAGTDNEHGTELWRLDTTSDQLTRFDIYPSSADSNPGRHRGMYNVGTDLYFSATDEAHGNELRRLDTTTGDITLVADIHVGRSDSYAGRFGGFELIGDDLVFIAEDGIDRYRPRILDTTTGMLRSVGQLGTRTEGWSVQSYFSPLHVAGDSVYLQYGPAEYPNLRELDGLSGMNDLINNSFDAGFLGAIGEKMYWWASNLYPASQAPIQYWVTEIDTVTGEERFFLVDYFFQIDGSKLIFSHEGQLHIYDSPTSRTTSYEIGDLARLKNFRQVGNNFLYFNASDPESKLRRLDLATGDISTISDEACSDDLTAVGDDLYCTFDRILHQIDSSGGITEITNSQFASNLTAVGDALFFTRFDSAYGNEILKIAGDTHTPTLFDIQPGTDGSSPSYLHAIGSDLFFVATTAMTGAEVHKLDSTTDEVTVYEVNAGPADSSVEALVPAGNRLFFSAESADIGTEPRRLDTETGMLTSFDINPGTADSLGGLLDWRQEKRGFAASSTSLYFFADIENFGVDIVSIPLDAVGAGGCELAGNDGCGANDIDALTTSIASGVFDPNFDINGDGVLDLGDRDRWLTLAGESLLGPGRAFLPGDANLDGEVDVSDFNAWNSNKFTNETRWSRGNFNADQSVDVSDFNNWNSNKFTTAGEIWVIENRVFGGRYISEQSDSNAVLTETVNTNSQWFSHADSDGIFTLQNRATGRFLASMNWDVGTVESSVGDIASNMQWTLVDNGDGSMAFQNVESGRYLDGDGASEGWDVDESLEILDDDGWFISTSGSQLAPAARGRLELTDAYFEWDVARQNEDRSKDRAARYRSNIEFLLE